MKRRRVVWWAAAGAALLGLLATALVLFDGEEGGPSEAWRAPDTDSPAGTEADTALWLHDSVVTRVTPSDAGVTGYDTADGQRLWRAEAPEGAGQPCEASDRTNADGIGAVLYTGEGGEDCTVLGVIDTRDGELLWSRDFPFLVDPASYILTTISDRTVTVNALDLPGGFFRFDLATGDELPPPTPPTHDGRECAPETMTSAGSRIVALSLCPGGGGLLSVYDVDTGELQWTREADLPLDGIASADPLILFHDEAMVAYSETGEKLWRQRPGEVATRAVTGDVLITESVRERRAQGVFAGYDVNSGERLWRSRLGEDWESFGVDDSGMLLTGNTYYHQDEGQRLHLSWLDAADGTEQRAETLPFPLEDSEVAVVAAFDTDRLYVTGTVERDLRLRAFDL